MLKTLFVTTAISACTCGNVCAQHIAATGTAADPVSDAFRNAPVEGGLGGATSAVASIAIDPPPDRIASYVSQVPPPADLKPAKHKVVVGAILPKTLDAREVAEDPRYAYAFVNNKRLIIDLSSRRVMQVLD